MSPDRRRLFAAAKAVRTAPRVGAIGVWFEEVHDIGATGIAEPERPRSGRSAPPC